MAKERTWTVLSDIITKAQHLTLTTDRCHTVQIMYVIYGLDT